MSTKQKSKAQLRKEMEAIADQIKAMNAKQGEALLAGVMTALPDEILEGYRENEIRQIGKKLAVYVGTAVNDYETEKAAKKQKSASVQQAE